MSLASKTLRNKIPTTSLQHWRLNMRLPNTSPAVSTEALASNVITTHACWKSQFPEIWLTHSTNCSTRTSLDHNTLPTNLCPLITAPQHPRWSRKKKYSSALAPAYSNTIQQVVGTFLYFYHAVNPTILVTLNIIYMEQANSTKDTGKKMVQLLNYAVTHP